MTPLKHRRARAPGCADEAVDLVDSSLREPGRLPWTTPPTARGVAHRAPLCPQAPQPPTEFNRCKTKPNKPRPRHPDRGRLRYDLTTCSRAAGRPSTIILKSAATIAEIRIITRYRLIGTENPFVQVSHIDLLHPTRAAFAGEWPDCRLQAAEQYLFRLYRDDDLPGYLIPQVWTGFLRHGGTQELRGILDHNRMDLLSLVALASVLAHTYAEPGHRYANPVALSRAHRRRGSMVAARAHLESCGATLSESAMLELASLYARSRQWKEAIALWEPLAARGVIEATERLAKYL